MEYARRARCVPAWDVTGWGVGDVGIGACDEDFAGGEKCGY